MVQRIDSNDLKGLCGSYDIINSKDLYYLKDFIELIDSTYRNGWKDFNSSKFLDDSKDLDNLKDFNYWKDRH